MMKYIQNHNMNPKRKLELRETANKKIGEICSHTYEEFDDLHTHFSHLGDDSS